MWRAAYRQHVQVCSETAAWVLAQRRAFDPDAEPLRRYAASWSRMGPQLAGRRTPRLVATAFDAALGEVVFEVRRTGSVAGTSSHAARLDAYLDVMTAHALFQPRVLVPALLAPLAVPAVSLLAFPGAARSALAALPAPALFVLMLAGVTVNALLVYATVKKVSDRPRLFGPYAYWAIPPGLSSVVLLFAVGYWIPAAEPGTCMNTALSRLDAVYFSLATFTTTGFGDLHPVSGLCRGLASLQMTLTFLLVVIGVGAFISRAASERPPV